MANTQGLRKWFSDKSIQIYFGSRTQDEIDYAVEFFNRMTPENVGKFKRGLAEYAGMMLKERGQK